MLPTSLPTVLPSVPQDEFQLPSLKNFDTERKRKVQVQGLPTLGSLGGRTSKGGKNTAKTGKGDDISSGLSRLIGNDGTDKKAVSKAGYSKGILDDLLTVVKTIEEECLLDPEKDKQLDRDLDPFFKCKDVIMQVVEETRELIEQRRRILEAKGMFTLL